MYMYADEPYLPKECFECAAKENKIDDIKYWLKYLMDQCYSNDKFSMDEFERALAEICFSIGMNIPENDPTIVRKVLR